jgi:GT2 family glycosyltransferase
MSVTVIIVNYNAHALLEKSLVLLSQQSLATSRVLVMDNGSTDGSADRVQQMSGVTVKFLGANLGFAAANNRALLECDSEFVVLLNPDAFPEPDWLKNLVSAANTYPDYAAFGSRQLNAATPEILDGTGDVYHISGKVWRSGIGKQQKESDLIAREIFTPCAAAALYRRQALIDVGGFDEDFFCYMEDVDLGFRLRLAGHKVMYVPEAVVHHIGSATTGGSRSDFSVYHGHRNLVWCFVKNMPGFLFWLLLPAHLLLNMVSIIWFVMRGQGRVIFRAKRDALLGLPKMWQKRKLIQASRLASIPDIWRILDKGVVFFKR